MRNILPLALAAAALLSSVAPAQSQISLSTTRHSPTDLEIYGDLPGVPANATRYISRGDLLHLPQTTFTASTDDENFATGFTQPVTVSGITLESLARALGINIAVEMPVALCADGYRANYPAAYIAAHHPVLVLAVNNLPPEKWPLSHYGDVMAPYIISHEKFTPSFRLLAHDDEQQIPYAVTRIEFTNQRSTFAAIAPRGHYAANSPEMLGYRIAQQNCYRCHNMGSFGGQMAHHPWQVLAAWAAYQPDYFTQYVRDPNSLRKNARMPGNPQYDAATIEALRRYFATFSPSITPATKERPAP
jgi:hypothetical protein